MFEHIIDIPTVIGRHNVPEDGAICRRPVQGRRLPRSRHPRHALSHRQRDHRRRRHRGADRPLARGGQAERQADPADGPHGRGRGQARGLVGDRPVQDGREGRLLLRPRHHRHEGRHRRHHPGDDQPQGRRASSPSATSSCCSPATRRPTASARRRARASGSICSAIPNSASMPTAAAAAFNPDGSPGRLHHADRREDLRRLHADGAQPRRPFVQAAQGQCDLQPRPRARQDRGLSLHADAERDDARLFRRPREDREGAARRRDAALARQSQ